MMPKNTEKSTDQAIQAAEKAEQPAQEVKNVDNPKEKPADEVEVVLNAENPVGNHTLYFENRRIEFENGIAKVDIATADALKQAGYVK